MDLALNDQQRLVCHKTQTNKQTSGYCTVVNCVFTFCLTNIFGFLKSIITQLELVKYKFLNKITLHIHQCSF